MAPTMERMVGIFLFLMSLLVLLFDSHFFAEPLDYTLGGWIIFGIIAAGSLYLIVDSVFRSKDAKQK